MINKSFLPKYPSVESAKLVGNAAKPWMEFLGKSSGQVWCTEPLTNLLKESGLASSGATHTLPSGINLHSYEVPRKLIQQALVMLAEGKTAFGPLKNLERANRLPAPASEIQKLAREALRKAGRAGELPTPYLPLGMKLAATQPGKFKSAWHPPMVAGDFVKPKAPAPATLDVDKEARRMRWERIIKGGEGASFLAQATAKAVPEMAGSAEALGAIFAVADIANLVTSKKGHAEMTFCLTGDILVIANAILPLVPHGEKAKPTLDVLGLLYKGAKSVHAAIFQSSQTGQNPKK